MSSSEVTKFWETTFKDDTDIVVCIYYRSFNVGALYVLKKYALRSQASLKSVTSMYFVWPVGTCSLSQKTTLEEYRVEQVGRKFCGPIVNRLV